ncbi:MAG TPA: NAD(P)/FAD-dependent oxidoreductase [Acidimicrobiales bacterium]|nr:NAD(P)/FAD-dependent oxidoreductase [Acidimicrobiales bacterium]
MDTVDAVVVGAGPNGLVAANLLIDAGWDVLLLEAQPEPGGAVRTAEVTAPGFRNDLYSAFYPLAAASSVIAALDLEPHGLRWAQAPSVVAHPSRDGPAAVLHHDPAATAASLDRFAPGDGDAWLDLFALWQKVRDPLLDSLLAPFPPVRGGLRLGAAIGPRHLLDFARFALLPVRRMADEHFRGSGGGLLLAGNALHADLSPEAAPSGMFGWLLASLGQDVGYPAPEGGAGELAGALVRRFTSRGGTLRCGAPVDRVVVEGGRARGVEVNGTPVAARRAVLADVDAVALVRHLVGEEHWPAVVRERVARVQRGWATVKVDWALRNPIPWADPDVRGAGTVHLAASMDELTIGTAELSAGRLPTEPFLVVGQMTTTDPTRSPPGTESAWAYTHVPTTVRDEPSGSHTGRPLSPADVEEVVRRVEARLEEFAPGFRDRVVARYIAGPGDLASADANLVAGDVGGGTYQLHQQLVFRPWPGLARPETPIAGLYLASASAHPGGGVHGACGSNAAAAALLHDRVARVRASIGGAGRRARAALERPRPSLPSNGSAPEALD